MSWRLRALALALIYGALACRDDSPNISNSNEDEETLDLGISAGAMSGAMSGASAGDEGRAGRGAGETITGDSAGEQAGDSGGDVLLDSLSCERGEVTGPLWVMDAERAQVRVTRASSDERTTDPEMTRSRTRALGFYGHQRRFSSSATLDAPALKYGRALLSETRAEFGVGEALLVAQLGSLRTSLPDTWRLIEPLGRGFWLISAGAFVPEETRGLPAQLMLPRDKWDGRLPPLDRDATSGASVD